MKNILIATILSSLAMFLWGFLYWMNPLVTKIFKTVENDAEAQTALSSQFTETGVYWVPGNMENESFGELHANGPLALVQYIADGKTAMDPKVMISGWIHMLLVSFVLSFLVYGMRNQFERFKCRVMFCTFMGLLGALFVEGSRMIWMFQPLPYTLFQFFYTVTTFAAAGFVIACFIKKDVETQSE